MSNTTRFVKIVSPLAVAIALAACGGDSSFGNGSRIKSTSEPTTEGESQGNSNPTSTVVASSISVSASSRQLSSDGSAPVTISVVAKDKNNNLLSGANVIFSVDKDANLHVNKSTGAVHTAILTPNTAENRTLTVTVNSGKQTKEIKVDVVGTTVLIDGPDAIPLNKEVPYVLKLKDSANKPLGFETVKISSSAGNTLKVDSSSQTDSKGELRFTMTGVAGGNDIIDVEVLGIDYKKEVKVSGDEFSLSGSLQDVIVGQSHPVSFTWKKNNAPQSGKTITISATRGDIPNKVLTTDANGRASFTISSETAGQTVITATSTDGLSTSLSGEFVAITPAYLDTQAAPSLISPKASSTIVAKIRDANDNPVKNKTISFLLNDTVNGQLSASTAVTDSLGRASVSYTAGDASSEKDGVSIKTYIQGNTSINDEVKLTVGGKALRIVLGHDNLFVPDEVYYAKTFGIIVTDSAGNPVKDTKVDFTITPTAYYKGRLNFIETIKVDGKAQAIFEWVKSSIKCPSEDLNNNGKLDAGEDDNGNGTLEPTHDATVTLKGSGTGLTDDQGKVLVEVIYPKNTAWWSDQRIEATINVNGTEHSEYTEFNLPILATDVRVKSVTPPNVVSPYGVATSCGNPD